MSPVEQYLTQEFGLTFLDARRITNEAKVSLQIEGYAYPEQDEAIRKASVSIFQNQPQETQEAMFQNKRVLSNMVMRKDGSSGVHHTTLSAGIDSSKYDQDASVHSRTSSASSASAQRSSRKKRFGLFKR